MTPLPDELKAQVAALTEEQRLDLYVYLDHLACVNDPEHRREMADRLDRLARGEKVSLDQFIQDNLPAGRVREGV